MVSQDELKRWRKLHQKKYRDREGQFLAEGTNLVLEALRSGSEAEILFVTQAFEKNTAFAEIAKLAKEQGVHTEKLSEKQFQALSETRAPQGVLLLVSKPARRFAEASRRNWRTVVALDGLQDPGNVGTIIRTADWYGCSAVVLGEGCAELTNSKVLRATAGSLFHLPVFEGEPLVPALEKLKGEGFALFAAESVGEAEHYRVHFPPRAVLIVGNERHGIRPEIKKLEPLSVRIPRRGQAESLNAAVAMAVVLDRLIFSGEWA
jgi:TrmH family RNA methyltransferase